MHEYRRGVDDFTSGFKREVGWTFNKLLLRIFLPIFLMTILLSGAGFVFGWFSEAAEVAQEEFGPREALRKYERFKDMAAALDNKAASILVYETRTTNLQQAYASITRIEWPREDREQYNQWLTEVAGVKASFNILAADYNSQMSKFNWRFANKGDLPQGALEALPREFKSYLVN